MLSILFAIKEYLKEQYYRIFDLLQRMQDEQGGSGWIKLAAYWLSLWAVNRCFIVVVRLLLWWLPSIRKRVSVTGPEIAL